MRVAKIHAKVTAHITVLTVLTALAAVSPATALDLNQSGSEDFCSALDARQHRVDDGLSRAQSEIRQSWQQQNDRIKVMVSERQSNNDVLIKVIDARRSQNLDQLRSSASTAEARGAVDTYSKTQKQAKDTRRYIISEANNSYNSALKQYVSNKQAAQAGQVEALRISIDDALQNARSQCATGVESQDAANTFDTSVQATRQVYMSQRKSDSVIVAQVQDLNVLRRQAVVSANNTYNAAMAVARQNLQSALK